MDLNIADRIEVGIVSQSSEIEEAIRVHSSEIMRETLATSLVLTEIVNAESDELTVDDRVNVVREPWRSEATLRRKAMRSGRLLRHCAKRKCNRVAKGRHER